MVEHLQKYCNLMAFKMAWRPSAVLDIWNSNFLTVGAVKRPILHHPTKFRKDRSNRCGDIAIFLLFSRWRYLGFVGRVLGPPTMTTCWSLSFAKFGWSRCSSFDNMKLLLFCSFGLKTPLHDAKIWVLGISRPKWGAISTKPPRHILARVRVVSAMKRENPSTGLICRWVRKKGINFKKIVIFHPFAMICLEAPMGGFAPNLAQL